MANNLERIAVVGTSCSGKSTLARRLAGLLNQPYIELDELYWDLNWTPKPDEEFRRLLSEAAAGNRWVIDGNYGIVQEMVLAKATTVVWLNYSYATIFMRALVRTIRRALFAEELFSGNRETFAKSFFSKESMIWWVITTFRKRRKQYQELRGTERYLQARQKISH